jgi:hypothetical protein
MVSDPALALYQSLLWASGGIDFRPVNRADTIFLLNFSNLRRSVGCIWRGAPGADSNIACICFSASNPYSAYRRDPATP